ncbi:hypothetical protein BCR41DRAFT_367142 [Lobosporangium transversale]|uniref:Uncharacterized protein n=1 Tax=Lobosporangium transversale TaxID=64571 RepID=A0A1Y2H3E4_9FUNG|nr:hypothetical protein BCR41DRAFT_367142 [Lobosporangium transversale]ORZ28511.1 hypothetical protein BCR41DRAFT_367142 [Lobosporangium transversale]|eukprot:XP_021886196.1 hypothetical protein BCR41DRAFT_367142 [Lobosporangium transversale]
MPNLVLETKEKESEMLKLQEKKAKMQVETKEKDDKIQHQGPDKLANLQKYVHAILTQNVELHEYVIPRLFIILPVDHTKWDPTNVLKNKIRVHFLCECGDHTAMTSKNSQKPLHITKHDGYEIRSSTEFFRKYGKHMFILLKWLKLGMTSSTSLAPSPNLMDAGIDCSIDYMEALSKEDPDLSNITTIDGYERLKGVDLQQLGASFRINDLGRHFGNLYRIMAEAGHLKWRCFDHCRSMYNEEEQKVFEYAVKTNSGKYDSHLGKLIITLKSEDGAKRFFNALTNARRVYELYATFGWDWTETDLEAFENALAVSSVSTLRLGLGRLQESSLKKVLSTSRQYETVIRVIELSNMKTIYIVLSPDLIKLLNLWPRKLSRLHKLTFETSAQAVGASELLELASSLKTNTALAILDLKNNSLGNEGTVVLSEALKANTTLTTLGLWCNSIGKEGALALSEVLETNKTLTTLNLQYNKIGDEGTLALSEVLKINTTLTILDLKGNSIGKKGALVLSEALKVSTSLIVIDLSENSFGKEGVLVLSEALKVNATLATLSLRYNSIGDKGALALSEALMANTTLTTMDLSASSIGREGILTLSKALKTNITLTTLNLQSNSIEDEGALTLSEVLRANTTLATLDLSYNSIGNEGARVLSEALKVNMTLITLGLWRNPIGDEGTMALSEALKANATLNTLHLEGISLD